MIQNGHFEGSIRSVMFVLTILVYLIVCTEIIAQNNNFAIPQIEFNPEQYICYRTSEPLEIDGEFEESDWQKAVRTNYFVDIEGSLKPRPRFWTYVKMLWDDNYLYIAAQIQEPHLWATLKDRDATFYQENDFEVFIDPDGDSHSYYEIELNAFGAFWDLFLVKPYRDGGPAISSWDIYGINLEVAFDGTINDPSDIDKNWRVEMAIPWDVLAEASQVVVPPREGDFWRMNFSRVVWPLEPIGGKYEIFKNRLTGKPVSSLNWVWSPQGLINMHYPEMWGYVFFSQTIAGEGVAQYELPESEQIKWILRQIYYEEKDYYLKNKIYTTNLSDLVEEIWIRSHEHYQIELAHTKNLFEVTIKDTTIGDLWHIRQDGLIWSTK